MRQFQFESRWIDGPRNASIEIGKRPVTIHASDLEMAIAQYAAFASVEIVDRVTPQPGRETIVMTRADEAIYLVRVSAS